MKVKVKNTKKGVKIVAECATIKDLEDFKFKVMELIAFNARKQEKKN